MRGEGYSLSDIAAATGNGNNGGFGGNGDWAWIVVLFLIFGWGRNGYGGFGGNGSGGTSIYEGYVLNNDFSQLSRQISDSTAMTERKLDVITNGLCTLGYDNLVQANNINGNISNLGMSLQNCCCDVKGLIADSKYEMAKGFCSTNNIITLATRDIIDNQNANYRALHDEIIANRIEDKNAQIQMQQNEINSLRLAASQSAQNEYLLNSLRNGCPVNAQLVCGNQPIPVQYITAGCNCNNGCGCNF